MMASMVVFTVLDTSAKFVMRDLNPQVAVFFRYAVSSLLSIILMSRSGGLSLMATRHPYLQVARGVLLMLSTILNFIAMSHLQLAQTSAILFTIPLLVCALSVPILGERVGPLRWAAVIAGFMGVLIIMRPGTAGFHWAMFCSLGASLCGASYNIITRLVGARDRAETSLFFVSIVGATAAALPLPILWQTPHGLQWLLLLMMGVCGAIGHFMLIDAHRKAPASTLAPFLYTQIVWMILSGYFVFGDVPDHWTLIGAAVVVASGLVVFAWDNRPAGDRREVPAPID